jgi:NAD(P)H-dependent flavin oxidoreductase YrpB (nitropropane dioxygenase family)
VIETAFTRLVGIERPLQAAGLPATTTEDLVAAVCEAGALGMVPTPLVSPPRLEATLDSLARRTNRGVFGANFLMPFLDPDCLGIAARKARVVEFFYGEPDAELVKRAAAHGSLVGWQVGSLREALAAERAGCHYVIAQGCEAGGHVRGTIGLLPLLAQVVPAVRIPALAAGGIATARDLAAVLAAGAAGARLGTRFVCCRESAAHQDYIAALLAARAEDTCLTEAYSAGWPNAPHRVLRSAIDAANALADETAGETVLEGRVVPVPRWSVMSPTRETSGRVDAMALYAGESVASIDRVLPAGEIVREICDGAEVLLRSSAGVLR